MRRTDYCGRLRESDIGRDVVVCGWVLNKRDMGGVIFLDLVDRTGTLQIVSNVESAAPETFRTVEDVRLQSVVEISGKLTLRDPETVNPKIETGTVEVACEQITVLSSAGTMPFSTDDIGNIREDLRLRYRYLDLRRPRMQRNIRLRHRVAALIRTFMDEHEFIEVETPILTKSTPEGARDYLVPSRVHPGEFYALPQSPQIFKQLLMVGGVDRYYQIARCFRDEDLRADRQPEFTQLDLEMSFVERDDVLDLLEDCFKYVMRQVTDQTFDEPFLRLTWQEAMDRFGSDKPDLRFGLEIVDLTDRLGQSGFTVFDNAVAKGGVVRAIRIPGRSDLPRGEIDSLTKFAIENGARGMAWIAYRPDGEIYSILTKFISEEKLKAALDDLGAVPGDFIVFGADDIKNVRKTLGALRLELGNRLDLRDPKDFRFLIVTDFPMFEYDEEAGRYVAQHHPFTMPFPDDIPLLLSDPAAVRSQAYDVVLNGTELGSGSIRIHDANVQRQVFTALGLSDETIEARFGFMLRAFGYGTPPHGGFAFGLDRLVMLILGESSLREVIAFPKIKDASDPMTGAPGPVDREQLDELNLSLAGKALEKVTASTQNARVSTFDIDKAARLARITLSEKEKISFRKDMEKIIDFASELEAIDTGNIPGTASILDIENVFQDESITVEAVSADELLSNAKAIKDGHFFVPEVLS